MIKNLEEIKNRLKSAGLKVTPQRVAVLDALLSNREHPSAEALIEKVRKENPMIAVGTIYNILDTFVKKNLVEKVLTDDNIVRYDAFTDTHFHIIADKKISDYYDEKLYRMVKNYLQKTQIPNFQLEGFEIILKGKFTDNNN